MLPLLDAMAAESRRPDLVTASVGEVLGVGDAVADVLLSGSRVPLVPVAADLVLTRGDYVVVSRIGDAWIVTDRLDPAGSFASLVPNGLIETATPGGVPDGWSNVAGDPGTSWEIIADAAQAHSGEYVLSCPANVGFADAICQSAPFALAADTAYRVGAWFRTASTVGSVSIVTYTKDTEAGAVYGIGTANGTTFPVGAAEFDQWYWVAMDRTVSSLHSWISVAVYSADTDAPVFCDDVRFRLR